MWLIPFLGQDLQIKEPHKNIKKKVFPLKISQKLQRNSVQQNKKAQVAWITGGAGGPEESVDLGRGDAPRCQLATWCVAGVSPRGRRLVC